MCRVKLYLYTLTISKINCALYGAENQTVGRSVGRCRDFQSNKTQIYVSCTLLHTKLAVTQFFCTHEYLHFWFKRPHCTEQLKFANLHKTIARFSMKCNTFVLSKRMSSMKHHEWIFNQKFVFFLLLWGKYNTIVNLSKRNIFNKTLTSFKWIFSEKKNGEKIGWMFEYKMWEFKTSKKWTKKVIGIFFHCRFIYIWNAIDRNSMNCRNVINKIGN